MSRLLIISDLHLGHNYISKYRTNFYSAEHHNIIFDSLASEINKRDSIIFLVDVAFDLFWLDKIKNIKCKKNLLICETMI